MDSVFPHRNRLRNNGLFAARYGALAFAAALAAAGPALAQPSGDSSFTGIHLDVVAGYDDEGVDFDDDVFNGGKRSQSGFLYGFGGGYDYQMGVVTLGIEAELSESTAGKERTYSGNRPTPCQPLPGGCALTTTLNIDAGGDIYVGGRIGFVANPQLLIYGKVGYTGHKIDVDGKGTDGGTAFSFQEKVNVHGFRLGIGGEYKFNDMFFGKVEYRYSNYNNGDLDVRGANVNLNPLFSGIDVVRHQVVVGAGVRF